MPIKTASATGAAVFGGSAASTALKVQHAIGHIVFAGSAVGEVHDTTGAATGEAVFGGSAAAGENSDLLADTYYVAYTYATIGKDNPSACGAGQNRSAFAGLGGETLESDQQSIAIVGGHGIQVTVPAFPSNAYGLPIRQANIYIGLDPSMLHYQGSTTDGTYTQTDALRTNTKVVPSQRYTREAPTLSAANGDSDLEADTYYFRYVWWTADGPQWFSNQANIVITDDQEITVTLPPFPKGVTHAYIYVSTDNTNELLQAIIEHPVTSGAASATSQFIEDADDFNRADNASMGTDWVEEGDYWEIISQKAKPTGYSWAGWNDPDDLVDTRVWAKCTITWTPGVDHQAVSGVVARLDTATGDRYAFEIHHYYLSLGPSTGWGWKLTKDVGAGPAILIEDKIWLPDSGQDYELKMEVVGDEIRCYIDGVLVAVQTDSDLSDGRAGIIGRTGGAGDSRVDDFHVQNLNAQPPTWTLDFPLVDGLPYFRNRTACTTVSGIFQFKPQGILDNCALKQLLVTAGDSVFVQEGARLLNVEDLRHPNRRYRGAQANDIFVLVNGEDGNIAWDGKLIRPTGFTRPTVAPTIALEPGDLNASSGYTYFIAFVEKASSGLVIRRSPLSPQSEATGPLTDQRVRLSWPTPPAGATHVEIYRNADNGQSWYRIASNFLSVEYVDETHDDDVGTYEANFDVDEEPVFSDIVLLKERLWALSGSELYFTPITAQGPDYEGWDLENALTIDTGDRDLPRTVSIYHEDLCVHYEDGLQKVSGFSEVSMRQRRIYTSTGAISMGGALNTGSFHFCLTKNGISRMAGDQMQPAMLELEKTWRTLSKRPSQREWWQGVRYETEGKDQLIWTVSTAGSRENDTLIVRDVDSGFYSLFGDFIYNCATLAIVEDATGRERMYRGDYYGGVWVHDIRHSDHGLPVPCRWLTMPYTRRHDHRHSLERWCYLYHRRAGGNLYCNVYVDLTETPLNGDTPIEIGLKGSDQSVWDEMKWDVDKWGGGEQADTRQRIHLGPRASHRIQFEFYQTRELAGKAREDGLVLMGLGLVGRARSFRS